MPSAQGANGPRIGNPYSAMPVTSQQVQACQNAPYITSVSPVTATAGKEVTLSGGNFAAGVNITVAGMQPSSSLYKT